MDTQKPQIPLEVLESEYKRALPQKPPRPDFFGLPAIPDDILDLTIKYLPWLVLAGAIFNGFGAAGALMTMSQVNEFSVSASSKFGTFLSLAASAVGVLAFLWLSDKRRLGWYMLAAALSLQLLSGLIISGGVSILSVGFSILLICYFLQQISGYYNE